MGRDRDYRRHRPSPDHLNTENDNLKGVAIEEEEDPHHTGQVISELLSNVSEFCCASNVVAASEAREPKVYRDCSNRLLGIAAVHSPLIGNTFLTPDG